MSGKMMGKKRKLKEQEKMFEKVEEKKSKKQVRTKDCHSPFYIIFELMIFV